MIQNATYKGFAQRAIAETKPKGNATKYRTPTASPSVEVEPAVQATVLVIRPSDWLEKLDERGYTSCPLNTNPFQDLSAYLKSLPTSDDPQKVFKAAINAAEIIAKAQSIIDQMLKQQAKI